MIALLRCPTTAQPLAPAPQELVARLLATRETLRNRDGEITAPFEAGFVTTDGVWFYPQRESIPVLLPGEAIATGSKAPK
jgi:uncharacterized protein YbaR (Trm112 family)